jgi:hypothetical protein
MAVAKPNGEAAAAILGAGLGSLACGLTVASGDNWATGPRKPLFQTMSHRAPASGRSLPAARRAA